jgi:hypothetical protein
MKIWNTTSWRKLFWKICLVAFSLSFASLNAQNVPFEVRNFLLDYEKVVDIGEFDTAILSNRFSAVAAEKFTNFFINKEILIFNDIAQEKGIPLYISPAEYVRKVNELYPVGLYVYISGTKILDVKEYSSYSLYIVEIKKTMYIDNMLENAPDQKFQSPVSLIYYIIRYNSTSGIKIIGIEAKGTASSNKTLYNHFIPDKIEFNAQFNSYKLNFGDIRSEYSDLKSSGNQNRFGILLGWDLGGKKGFRYGISSGLYYDKTNYSTDLESYTDRPIPSIDKDGYPYKKIITGAKIDQSNSMSHVSLPVYLNFNWELPAKWGNKYTKRSFTNDLAYKRGININFRIGPHLQYHLSGSNDPYSGTFSYGGQYTFYNPAIQDSATIFIDNLPEYGFVGDTSFTTSATALKYQKLNIGLSSQLNISFPINKSLEFYVGPSLYYNFSGIAETEDDFILSGQIGENNSLASSSKTTSVAYGINAGLVLNLHAPRVPYSTIRLPEVSKDKYKVKTAYTLEKDNQMKMALNVNLIRGSGMETERKVRIGYQVQSDWMKKPAEGKFSSFKTYSLKYNYPKIVGKLNFKSDLVIEKPFGYDIICSDTLASNSVNTNPLIITLDNLNRLAESHQPLDLTVARLPNFNFIYVSLYNKNETLEQRRKIVELVRDLGNNAIINQEELLVYLSSEANKPIAFTNFVSGDDLPENIITDWQNFLYKLEEEYNSQDLIYEDDIRNIDEILNPILNLDERANAQRRFVNYHFIVNESEKYYGIDAERQSDIRTVIYFISNKYCSKIPFKSSQFTFNVYLTERYMSERRSPSDININIIHLIK